MKDRLSIFGGVDRGMLRSYHHNCYTDKDLSEKIATEAERLRMSRSRFLESLAKKYFSDKERCLDG